MAPLRRELSTNSALPFLKPNPLARLRLFCFPYAGAGATVFHKWYDKVPSFIELCSVQLPGRETWMSADPFTRLQPLIEAIAREILPYLDKPFVFFGHSMGALLSFELARHLRSERGLSPDYLFVSGRRAPHIVDAISDIHSLPDTQFLEKLRDLSRTHNGSREREELARLFLPIIRADIGICETYVYTSEPPLICPVLAFGGLDDDIATEALLAWREHTVAEFRLQMLPGEHFFIHSAESLFLRILLRECDRITRVSS